ncbi:hypothetical protein KZX46_21415 (plasmid) [Polymorphobacter sp. PAMC 29334]|uniref:hypothetical protein n=1 Tax=Polymorphobacter sp. PAMC 29334 TaxID=2862331 RepID=UPI001C76D092|nr:hypothetical protein [Polymorphobacter sp. PAMC 29334]QYE37199.1 hypothetical protein KZX46_21415 [Polymorphobacter sp. PAMC 29334]
MADVAFNDSAGMTIMEIGMAMLLMRAGTAELDDFAAEFARRFRVPVEPFDLRPCYNRMIERGWLEPHPTEAPRVLVTLAGEQVTYAAFSGFIRLVDPTGQYFKASMVFALTTRRHEEDDDD